MILSMLFASPVLAFKVSLFVPRDDTRFWSSLVRLSRSAANDLGLTLTVHDADNRGDTMLEQVKTACSQGTDGIIFMNYENIGEEILRVAGRFKVPALLYNTGFADPMMVPRKQFPFWIGSITPDDVRAGGLLAERLIEIGKDAGWDNIRMVAIQGNPLEKSSIDRVQGLKTVVLNRDDVTLHGIMDAGKSWSREKAKAVFESTFRRYPDINTVWAAGDDIALGVMDAVNGMGMGRDRIVIGGIDWSDEAVKNIRSNQNKVSVGGHMLEGAWALILMYDYLNAMDFSQENTVFNTGMYAIDSSNADQVSGFLSDSWERIDFKGLSKYQNESLLYHFDLLYLIDTFYPRGGVVTLTEPERKWLAQHPRIRLGIDLGAPPFESLDPDGKYQGITADYIQILEDRLGIRFVYSGELSWSETLKSMEDRQLDMIAAIAETAQRQKSMTFTQPYLTSPLVVITNEQVDFVEDMKALNGLTVAVVRDYTEHEMLRENYPAIDLYPEETTAKALNRVVGGKAYAYVGKLATANYAIRQEGITNLKVSGTIPHGLEISMAVRNDWPLFATLVEKAMASISEKERDAIYQKWITLRYEHGFDYGLFLKVLLPGLVVLWAAAHWIRRLSTLNLRLRREILVRNRVEDELRKEKDKVKLLAAMDPLTGLFNRRKFKELFLLDINRIRRSSQYLAFAVMDIDYFKQYNDFYGHQMGDDALVRVGKLLLDHCRRATDHAFRLGGEEFGILFTTLDPDQAMGFVEEVRIAIQGLAMEHQDSRVADYLTASFGCVVSAYPSDMESMYKAADQALYRAKQTGRNRTEMEG
ncbi:MAG: transporter substrate-binding domain-containing protein [Desulfobacterium sp.]|nr:transporter substrate-binding domain-containing protein [Desulfobacterium sp.]